MLTKIKNIFAGFLLNRLESIYYLYWCYRAGKNLKNPSKLPFIPFPISKYPFRPEDNVNSSLLYRLQIAETVIDNVFYLSHEEGVTDLQLILDRIKEDTKLYISMGPYRH